MFIRFCSVSVKLDSLKTQTVVALSGMLVLGVRIPAFISSMNTCVSVTCQGDSERCFFLNKFDVHVLECFLSFILTKTSNFTAYEDTAGG